MTETGILNREIAAEMVKMGHMDMMIITDAGLAVPNSVKVIDLSLKENIPTAVEVLKAVLENFSVEKYIISQATVDVSPSRQQEFKNCFREGTPCEVVPHSILRDVLTQKCKFAIRSGDFTANSNIVLVSAGGPRWYCEKG